MKTKRRRIRYTDKIFQKKLILILLGINCLIIIANVLFYVLHLRSKLEAQLYRSHISISNINEIMASDVIHFNLLLAICSLLLILIFYISIRLKLNQFFKKIKHIIQTQPEKKFPPTPTQIPKEFHEIQQVFTEFIQYTDKKHTSELARLQKIREKL